MSEHQLQSQNVVNLLLNAGKGSCPASFCERATGEPFGTLPQASRPGYRFDGWFTQPDVNGEKILPSDTVNATEDITLYAHFTKLSRGNSAKRKKSLMRTQKYALFALLGAIVVLAILLAVASNIASVVRYTDYDGAVYEAKKSDGSYVLYDADGAPLSTNSDGYYLTVLGTQLSLNAETGEITEFAVVDTAGTEQVGPNSRILMFAQIRQSDVAKLTVENGDDSYTFYLDDEGNVKILGFEKFLVSYDKEKYAYLCVGAGYPLTQRRLDPAQVEELGLAEYGLVPETRTDADGNEYEYKPIKYTVTSKSGVSYTVLIGDATVTGNSFYCKLDGDENKNVYIMNGDTYKKALLLPVEELITPMIVYPMESTSYFNVKNFVLARCLDGDTASLDVQVAFDYIPMPERNNTMFSADIYRVSPLFKYPLGSYRLAGDTVSNMLQCLYQTNFVGIRKLGLTDEALREYGLDSPAFVLSYDYEADTDGDGKTDATIDNFLMISERTESGTYYVASALCNVIAEVHESSFSFLENRTFDWINQYIIWYNLAYVRRLNVRTPDGTINFTFDNSASDQSQNINSNNLRMWIDGVEPDYIVYKTSASTGRQTQETPVYNFRQFYKALLYASIGGQVSDGKITLTEEEMAAFRAMDDSECQLVLTIEAEDYAATTCPDYFKENNTATIVCRFYRYSEGRSYLTINGEGEFFVDASFVEKLIADAARVRDGVLVDSESKS